MNGLAQARAFVMPALMVSEASPPSGTAVQIKNLQTDRVYERNTRPLKSLLSHIPAVTPIKIRPERNR
jgi:hypothetical protein